MKKIIFLLFGLTFTICVYSHPWKPSHYVIIDTDGGIDDIRTISMLLASPDIRVLAVTVSPGVLSAENAYKKVKSLLGSFYHEGLPVGINRESNFVSENFPFALQTYWGAEEKIKPAEAPEAIDLINDILASEKTKISFICLGSMSTAYRAFMKTGLFSLQVKEILWSTDGSKGFNYNIDRNAADKILKQEIVVKNIYKYDSSNLNFYDDELIKSIGEINSIYAKKISAFFYNENAKSHQYSFEGRDEMVAIYIHYPDLFLNKKQGFITECMPYNTKAIKESALKILAGETVLKNQVVKEFPADPSFYSDDIRPWVNEIINK